MQKGVERQESKSLFLLETADVCVSVSVCVHACLVVCATAPVCMHVCVYAALHMLGRACVCEFGSASAWASNTSQLHR